MHTYLYHEYECVHSELEYEKPTRGFLVDNVFIRTVHMDNIILGDKKTRRLNDKRV